MSQTDLDEKACVSTGVDVYVPAFRAIAEAFGLADNVMAQKQITIPTSFFRFLMSSWLLREGFDEVAYRKNNPDVDASIRAGKIEGAKSHYVLNGYYEGRAPGVYSIDANWYRNQYPDIALAEKKLLIKNSQDHFNTSGRFEGRAGSASQFRQQLIWKYALSNG